MYWFGVSDAKSEESIRPTTAAATASTAAAAAAVAFHMGGSWVKGGGEGGK